MSGLLHREPDHGPLFANLTRGRELRDEGIAQVESRAVSEEWRIRARAWVKVRARSEGEFNADDLRREVGPPPGHYNAMGGIFAWALEQGLIERCGERPRQLASAHCQRIATYRGRGGDVQGC